jgi:hypothetical protein
VRLARRADPLKKGENAEMAKFEAFVKELVPDDPAMKLFAAGVTTNQASRCTSYCAGREVFTR